MPNTVVVDPVSRIEGHLKIRLEVEGRRVVAARSSGEMFRGFEQILTGRDPMDAQLVTQRICGVCPISHGIAASIAQEQAYGVRPARNGRILRNLLLVANTLQSHIVHFYQLAALDFVDVTALLDYDGDDPDTVALAHWAREELNSGTPHPVAPLLPRPEGTYLSGVTANVRALQNYGAALGMRRTLHEMIALFAGKMPHANGLVPTGVTGGVDVRRAEAYASRLREVRDFVHHAWIDDVVALGHAFDEYFGLGRAGDDLLAYGGLELDDGSTFYPRGVILDDRPVDFDDTRITEDNLHSYIDGASGVHPTSGETHAHEHKQGAYSWIKAPRYDRRPVEVGPAARLRVAAAVDPEHPMVRHAEQLLGRLGHDPSEANTAMGRHVARLAESLALIEAAEGWITELEPGARTTAPFEICDEGRGMGLVEAPRGALGHWMSIRDRRIDAYQCVVPTTWNCSPADDDGVEGPVEASLRGVRVADPDHPIEAMRVVRPYEPCLACAVH